MALSAREILLVLRARDEASRTLYHVSGAMKRLGTTATTETARMIEEQKAALFSLQRQLGDINVAYSRTTASALENHRQTMRFIEEQTVALRDQEHEIRANAAEAIAAERKKREAGRISAETFSRNAAEMRAEMRKQLGAIREQQSALEKLGLVSKRVYQEEITEARKLHIEQVESVRQTRLLAQEQLRQHEARMRELEAERARMRAQGQALMGVGQGAIATGASFALAGAVGVYAFSRLIKASVDYEQQSRRTLTQVDKTHASLQKIEDIGKQVAKTIPVEFSSIQPALYDVFSSIDVGYRGASKLLKQFAKDAVGGNSDIETATRANVAIMNAYGIKVKDVGKVSDFMFQLVRKGVGTYDEFAKSIGQSIPSAVRLGVSLNQLGGTLSFLTRNGLSAARASTSAARAFDALSNPKTAANLKALGVNILNAKGDLKSFPKIMDLIAQKMKGMNKFQKSEFLKTAFLGSGGTIQAMRFFNLAFRHMDEFHKRIGEMKDDAGTAGAAYEQMRKSVANQLQLLKNKAHLLAIELGTYLLPYAEMFIKWLISAINWFEALPTSVKKAIVVFGAIATVLSIIVGLLLIVGGGIAILIGGLASLGISMGTVAGIIAGVGVALALVAAAFVYAKKHWAEIKPIVEGIKTRFMDFINYLSKTFGPAIKRDLDKIKQAFEDFKRDAGKAWNNFKNEIDVKSIDKKLKDLKKAVGDNKDQIVAILNGLTAFVQTWIRGMGIMLIVLGSEWAGLFNGVIGAALTWAKGMIQIFSGLSDMYRGTGRLIKAIITGDFRTMGKAIAQIVRGTIRTIEGLWNAVPNAILALLKGMAKGIIHVFEHIYNILVGHSIVPETVNAIVNWFGKLPGLIVARIAGLPGKVGQIFSNIKTNIIGKLHAAKTAAVGAAKGIAQGIVGAFNGLAGDMLLVGQGIMSGLANGLSAGASWVYSKAKSIAATALAIIKAPFHVKSPSKTMHKLGRDIMRGLENGLGAGAARVNKFLKKWVKSLTKGNIRLRAKGLLKDLDAAHAKVERLRSAQKQFASDVRSTIKDYGSLASISAETDVFGNPITLTKKTIASGLKKRLNTIRRFGRLLKRLLKVGYNKAIYSQVVQMGPDDGVPYAQALLQATPKQVRQINQTQSQIDRGANRIAKQSSRAMYQAGVAAAEGLVKGLKAREHALVKVAREMGKTILKEIKKILGIHSPSKQAKLMGFNFANTFAKSMRDQIPNVKAAARDMAGAANSASASGEYGWRPGDGPRRPGGPKGVLGASSGTQHNHYNTWNVTTTGDNAVATARKLAWEYERRFKKV